MSNNTARLARQWAENIDPSLLNERARAAAEHILATTTPLTMADVEWDYEKHHLAGATTPSGIEVVMVQPAPNAHHIVTGGGLYARDMLTPNGKRYELREVTDEPVQPDAPTHPATLTTEADYEDAPVGTIVADNACTAYAKKRYGRWDSTFSCTYSDTVMADAPRKVLRWGPGEGGGPCEPSEPTVSSDENVGADQQEHPETLVTEQDYENAPEGTAVAEPGYTAWTKVYDGNWWRGDEDNTSHWMAGTKRDVLRWGWGK